MKVRGGRNLYGHDIGILVLDTVFPRIPGDIGHAGTFPFPVLYHKVRNASPARVVREGDPALLEGFVAGARTLEASGVLAITTSCGFLALFQRQLAEAVRVPVFTSALQLVPLVSRMLGPDRAVGVLTVDGLALGPRHLAGAGITEDILTNLSKIKGMRVASRNAVARFRGAAVDIPRVASELGVGVVLEGSVRQITHSLGLLLLALDRLLRKVYSGKN